jgi:tetratricopeptide (TPR) repeat protein
MPRELSQNGRRLAALAAVGLLWGAFLIAIGFPVPLVMLALGGVILGAAAALERHTVVPRLLGVGRTEFARVSRIDWAAKLSVAEAQVRRLRRRPGRRDAMRLSEHAAALRQEGRPGDAVEPIEEALAIFRRVGDRRGEAVTLNRLGLTQARIGDEAGALDSYETAVGILTELGDSHGAGRVLANLGALQRGQGHQEQARATWIDALERLEPGSPEHDRTAQQLKLAS